MFFNTRNLDTSVISEIKNEIMDSLPLISTLDKLVVFNVGTERVDFDSFGPILGTLLEKKIQEPRFREISMFLDVMGTVDNPCHGINLHRRYEEFNSKYEDMNVFVIATDAASTLKISNLNRIYIERKQLKPGSAINRRFKSIGDISICMSTVYSDDPRMMSISKRQVSKRHIEKVCNHMADIILEAVRDKMLLEF